MSPQIKTYCLDANVLIQAWQKYYSPRVCPSYWDVLKILGNDSKIFLPEMVYEEIVRTGIKMKSWGERLGNIE